MRRTDPGVSSFQKCFGVWLWLLIIGVACLPAFAQGEGEGEVETEAPTLPTASITLTDATTNQALLPNNLPVPLINIDASLVPDEGAAPGSEVANLDTITFTIQAPTAVQGDQRPLVNPDSSYFSGVTLWRDAQGTDQDGDGVWDRDDFFIMHLTIAQIVAQNGGRTQAPFVVTFRVFDTLGLNAVTRLPSSTEDPNAGDDFFVTVSTADTYPNYGRFAVSMADGSLQIVDFEPGRGTHRPSRFTDLATPVAGFNVADANGAFDSSFGIYSSAGQLAAGQDPRELMVLDYPGGSEDIANRYPYVIANEFLRPRFDVPVSLSLEAYYYPLHIASLIPMEVSTSVLAIDAHAGTGDTVDSLCQWNDIKVTLSDVNGDPLKPAGNGGFNPLMGLDFLLTGVDPNSDSPPESEDVSHSGINLFRDTNGNGQLDPPTIGAGGTVTLNDVPYTMSISEWGYEANPIEPDPLNEYFGRPTGEPEWSISIFPSSLRQPTQQQAADYSLETAIDQVVIGGFAHPQMDYFVAVRADSGYRDSRNELTGAFVDGTSIEFGADFRAFIKPGNILFSLQQTFDPAAARPGQRVTFTPNRVRVLPSPTSGYPIFTGLSSYKFDPNTGLTIAGGSLNPSTLLPNPAGLYLDQADARIATAVIDVHDLVMNYGLETDPSNNMPFYNSVLDVPAPVGPGPRSVFYPNPPPAPLHPRTLTEHVSVGSGPVPMLGINMVNTPDLITLNYNNLKLASVKIALVGDTFTPDDLLPLTADGMGSTGISIWADNKTDTSNHGVFYAATDTQLPLVEATIAREPTGIDLNGDGQPDDVNRDGVVDNRDKGYVATLRLNQAFQLYTTDNRSDLGLAAGEPDDSGDDLFICVQPSTRMSYAGQFQMVIPSGGLEFRPTGFSPPGATEIEQTDLFLEPIPRPNFKGSPLLNEVLKLTANVQVFGEDLTSAGQTVTPNSGAIPLIGLDMATNDPDKQVFFEYLVVELYNAGVDANGDGQIDDQDFDIKVDLAPLDVDSSISGVALYRDNDADPRNRNGVFDPDIDIPVRFDDKPDLIGVSGEPPIQVRMVFSSPGTDNFEGNYQSPKPLSQQPNLRQPVPKTLGVDANGNPVPDNPDSGPDYFVVIRTSGQIEVGDDFSAGIVAWGPDTPTGPDPDTFTDPPQPIQPSDEYENFVHDNWGSRATGFVEILPTGSDPTGFDFIRTTSQVRIQTNILTAAAAPTVEGEGEGEAPIGIQIDDFFPPNLPTTSPGTGDGIEFVITGSAFGATPLVEIDGKEMEVRLATNNFVVGRIPPGTTLAGTNLRVTSTASEVEERSDLFGLITAPPALQPDITGVTPSKGEPGVEVEVVGVNFDTNAQLFLRDPSPNRFTDEDRITVTSRSSTSLKFVVPEINGGERIVRVVNPSDNLEDISYPVSIGSGQFDGGFDVVVPINPPVEGEGTPTPTPARTTVTARAAAGTELAPRLGVFREYRDSRLLGSVGGSLVVDSYYRHTAAVTKYLADHAGAESAVRAAMKAATWLYAAGGAAYASMRLASMMAIFALLYLCRPRLFVLTNLVARIGRRG